MLAPLLETLISPELFQDECHGISAREPNESDIGPREAVIVLNPNKYTVKEDEEDNEKNKERNPHDSIVEEETKLSPKKPATFDDDVMTHRTNAVPPSRMELDPVELMPNLKYG